LIKHYMENARSIREAVKALGLVAHGGEQCPYVWVEVIT
jgi:hypothetical protein